MKWLDWPAPIYPNCWYFPVKGYIGNIDKMRILLYPPKRWILWIWPEYATAPPPLAPPPQCGERFHRYRSTAYSFYLPPVGDINLHHVCECVRACVTQFSLRLLQLDIFCQRRILMNFNALEYFFGFIHFELKLSE